MSETKTADLPSIYDEVQAPVEQDGTPPEPEKDVETILPPMADLALVIDGKEYGCRVRRLKTREFLALLHVMTSGLGPALGDVGLDLSDEESVQRDLVALMLLAIPNAVDEFTMFLRQVVEPKDPRDQAVVANYLMENPDIDAMIDVFEHVATQEKDDLVVLAGKAQAMWRRLGQVYRPKQT